MKQDAYQVYGYRWVVLVGFMLVVLVNQLLWITFAPITSLATAFYGVSELSIGLLSLIFMAVYILVSIPASWAIDSFGIRVAVGIGAVLTGVFGLLRGLLASNYTWVLICQIGVAVGQPFILNAITTVAARWFPVSERATASGFGSLAMYLGILLGLALTPFLTLAYSLSSMLLIYGIVSAVLAILFLLLGRERPATPPCRPDQEARSLVFDGLKETLRNRNFGLLMFIFFIGLGTFNAVTTWIEAIVAPRGFSVTQAGSAGGLMIAGGVLGALVLPTLSDRSHRRLPFIIICLIGTTAALIGVTYAGTYAFLLLAAFAFGLFLLSAGPIGFQYGAEVAYPAPEGTTNGLLLMMGQISGILFILGMDSFKAPSTGSMTVPLLVVIGLMLVSLVLSTRLHESPLMKAAGPSAQAGPPA
jgi:sugar phosphate permease